MKNPLKSMAYLALGSFTLFCLITQRQNPHPIQQSERNLQIQRKARASSVPDVLVHDFETKQEKGYKHSELYYPQSETYAPNIPSQTIRPFGVHGSPEAYYKMPYSAVCTLISYYDLGGDGVFACGGGDSSSSGGSPGHAWISVENLSNDRKLKAGYADLNPGKAVGLGLWGGPSSTMYYNREYLRYAQGVEGFNPRYSISGKVFIKRWEDVNSFLLTKTKWTPTHNCSTFATEVWNYARPLDTMALATVMTPNKLIEEMKKRPDVVLNSAMKGGNVAWVYSNGSLAPVDSEGKII